MKTHFSRYALYVLCFTLHLLFQPFGFTNNSADRPPADEYFTVVDSSDFQPGILFFKLNDDINWTVNFPSNGLTSDDADFQPIFSKYSATVVERPFFELNHPIADRTYLVHFNQKKEIDDFISDLMVLSSVDYAEKIPYTYSDEIIPDDPYIGNSNQMDRIRAFDAFEYHQTTSNVSIAIVDNAILTSHEDLAPNIAYAYDVADDEIGASSPPAQNFPIAFGEAWSHGTHVTGIAAALNNDLGIGSPGGGAKIFTIKCTQDNTTEPNVLLFAYDGIKKAIEADVDIINMSFGRDLFYIETEYNLLRIAQEKGIILVASAGNNNHDIPHYPAAYGEGTTGESWEVDDPLLVIAVANIDFNNNIYNGVDGDGSSYGEWVDISTYGKSIYSAVAYDFLTGDPSNTGYQFFTGTSMSAPLVSGVVGLMKSYAPQASSSQIIQCLLDNANPDLYDYNDESFAGLLGSGRMDAFNALRCLMPGCETSPVLTQIEIIDEAGPGGINDGKICIGESVTLIAEGESDYTYEWSTGASTQSIEVFPLNLGANSYKVTVTDDNGCPSVIEQSVTVIDCEAPCPCTLEGQIAIEADEINGTSFSDPDLGFLPYLTELEDGYEWNGGEFCFSIKGKLLIDSDLRIYASSKLLIQMQPGSSIDVTDNAAFVVENQGEKGGIFFSGCEFLWEGINVKEGHLKLSKVFLDDAQLGINLHNMTSAQLIDNQFSKNFVNVFHYGDGDISLIATGNIFNGTAPLLPSLDFDSAADMGIDIEGHSYAGVYFNSYLDESNTIFFGSSGAPNIFDGLPIGIRAIGFANLVVAHKTIFNNIQPTNVYPLEEGGGRGVWIDGSKDNNLKQLDGEFTDCTIGIDASSCSVKLLNNKLQCDQTAIHVENVENGSLIIKDSNIEMNTGGIGINLLSNDQAVFFSVSKNTITLTVPAESEPSDDFNAGINVNETLFRSEPVTARLKNNDIDLTVGENTHGSGIFLQGVRYLDVKDHDHIVCHTAESIGISVHGSQFNLIKDNDVTGNAVANPPVGTGMEVLASSDNYISCNYFHQLHTGTRFGIGNSDNTELHRNVFGPPLVDGLHYMNNLDITSQDWQGNQWFGDQNDYLGDAAVNEAVNISDLIQQRYRIHSFSNGYFPPSINTTITGGEGIWFVFNDANTPKLCTSAGLTSPPPTTISPDQTIYYRSLMGGQTISGDFGLARSWEVLRQGYHRIQMTSILDYDLAVDFAHFQTLPMGEKAAAFNATRQELDILFSPATDLQEQLEELLDLKASLLEEAILALSATSDHEVYAAILANTQSEMASIDEHLNEIKTLIEDTQHEGSPTLREQIAALEADILPQINEQQLDEIIFNYQLQPDEEWSEATIAQLEAIAMQCPLAGGKVVYLARSLYAHVDPFRYFSNNCDENPALRIGNNTEEEIIHTTLSQKDADNVLRVYPNPANNLLQIEIQLEKVGNFELINSLGQVVKKLHLPANTNHWEVSIFDLPDGIYTYRVYDNDDTQSGGTLIIAH